MAPQFCWFCIYWPKFQLSVRLLPVAGYVRHSACVKFMGKGCHGNHFLFISAVGCKHLGWHLVHDCFFPSSCVICTCMYMCICIYILYIYYIYIYYIYIYIYIYIIYTVYIYIYIYIIYILYIQYIYIYIYIYIIYIYISQSLDIKVCSNYKKNNAIYT